MRCWLNAMILYGSCGRLYLKTKRKTALNSLLMIFLVSCPLLSCTNGLKFGGSLFKCLRFSPETLVQAFVWALLG
jgi:hypothetical protein